MFKSGRNYMYNNKYLIEYDHGMYKSVVPYFDEKLKTVCVANVYGQTVMQVIRQIDAIA